MAISVVFILSFGLVATSVILRASRFDDLFTGTTGIALDSDK